MSIFLTRLRQFAHLVTFDMFIILLSAIFLIIAGILGLSEHFLLNNQHVGLQQVAKLFLAAGLLGSVFGMLPIKIAIKSAVISTSMLFYVIIFIF